MKTIAALIAIAIAASAGGDSLWTSGSRSLFADVKARQAGDILNIIVVESATASAAANTKTSKSEDASTAQGTGPLLGNLFAAWGLSGKTNTNATGTTSRSDSLQARIAVVVKEVLPNGNLVIEGTRSVMINKEERKMILTGEVRPQDVQPDNTVSSTLVAKAEIRYDGKGPLGNKQREGLITKIFKWFF